MQVSLPDPTAPKVGGVPQSHNFFHPHFSNHATVLAISETFKIGVKPLASIAEQDNTRPTASPAGRFSRRLLCKRLISPPTTPKGMICGSGTRRGFHHRYLVSLACRVFP